MIGNFVKMYFVQDILKINNKKRNMLNSFNIQCSSEDPCSAPLCADKMIVQLWLYFMHYYYPLYITKSRVAYLLDSKDNFELLAYF